MMEVDRNKVSHLDTIRSVIFWQGEQPSSVIVELRCVLRSQEENSNVERERGRVLGEGEREGGVRGEGERAGEGESSTKDFSIRLYKRAESIIEVSLLLSHPNHRLHWEKV